MEISRFKIFSEFQKSDFLTDIHIKLNDGSINAHKLVLAANSEFFKMLFSNSLCKEVTTGVVDLPCIDCVTFTFILDYIYFRNDDTFQQKDISFYIDVIAASDFLGMCDFIKLIDLKLSTNFNSTYLKNFERISCYNLTKTVKKCEKCVIESIAKKDFLKLIRMPTEVLIKFVESSSFAVDENVLFNFINYFIKNKESIEKDSARKLLENVRVSLLTEHHFLQFNELVRNFDVDKLNKVKSVPRCVSFLYVVNRLNNNFITSVDKIDLSDNARSEAVSISALSYNLCICTNNFMLLMKDNVHSTTSLGTLINLATSRGTLIGSLQYHLSDFDIYLQYGGFTVLCIDSDIYITGGFYLTHENLTVATNTVVKYSTVSGVWKLVEGVSLKEPCWSHAVSVADDNPDLMYVSGGRNRKTYLTCFYCIDLRSKIIVDLPPLPKDAYGHKMNSYKSVVFIFDSNHKNEVFLFDTRHSLWRVVDCSMSGTYLHLSYCFGVVEDHRRHSIALYELTRNVCEDKMYVFHRQILINEDDLSLDPQTTFVVSFKDSGASDIYMAQSVYGCERVTLTSNEDFESTCDSD